MKKAETGAPTETGEAATLATTAPLAASDPSGLKFSRDIAPIFVAHCLRCHNDTKDQKGKFSLTTYEKLMKGSAKEKVIIPGNPAESELLLRVKGESESGKKMPPGNRDNLAGVTIEKIEKWVQAGAPLDTEISPAATLASYAATPEQRKRDELAKIAPDQRDKQIQEVGLERWKKASPKNTPEVTSSKNFLLFGTLPKDRATATLKTMEAQLPTLHALLGHPGAKALSWVEKTSLYVFNDTTSLVEFIRTIESRETEASTLGTAKLSVEQPYVAVVDPLGGRAEPITSKKAARSRRDRDEDTGGERSLAGILTEYLAIGVLAQAGSPPPWLTLGVGAFLSSRIDPRSLSLQKLRKNAYDQFEIGWGLKAKEALGGETKAEDIQAVGFAIIDWIGSDPQSRPYLPAFIQGMLEGTGKLDQVIANLFNGNRDDFLVMSGQWVAQYGAGRSR